MHPDSVAAGLVAFGIDVTYGFLHFSLQRMDSRRILK